MINKHQMYAQIEQAFHQLGITLKDELRNSNLISLAGSNTNQSIKVSDTKGQFYLVRINGKLWPPFSRADEAYNLSQLNIYNIDSNVLYNDPSNGFQISRFVNDQTKFSAFANKKSANYLLGYIGRSMRKIHQLANFKNRYQVSNTVNASFNRIPENDKSKLRSYHKIILNISTTLNNDQDNFVSSHNDLLPSNVYYRHRRINFIDWEYAAENHRSYDLAFFAVKSALSPEQEQNLITAYDPNNVFNIGYFFSIMKPVINYLLLVWNLSSRQNDNTISANLLIKLTVSLQEVIAKQSGNMLIHESKSLAANEAEFDTDVSLKYVNSARTYCK